ncbi:MAG: bifunctional 3-phenylpropionate/cinnamic acid dioxygenase ferredoxin subunit [Rhodocyclaceae bacterium]|nr:bifunctional 3-phenylpropionate/cinnamic acid dioxygenase ferredoxin subunit [Rhodocyclaceae bacterium]
MVSVCKTDEVAPGTSLRVEIDGLPPLAVFNVDDEFFVIDDTCTHGDASLCDGEIEDGQVECPWHNARFCIKTGKALTFPAVVPQKTYVVRVLDGTVHIEKND